MLQQKPSTYHTKAIICELQPVSVQAGSEQPNEKEISDIMSLIEVTKSNLNDQQLEQGLQLIKSYIDIFSDQMMM